MKEEHAVFRRMIRELEGGLGRAEEQLRPVLIKKVKFLLPALHRHEQIEHTVFAGLFGAPQPRDREILRAVGLQHDALEGLCKDMALMLKHEEEYSFEHLRTLAGLLARNLAEHLDMEEKRLWPRMRRKSPAEGPAGGTARVERLVRRLEGMA